MGDVVYISGKITGTTDYLERFDSAERFLREQGYEVINPARVMEPISVDMPYELFMDMSFVMINYCDVIYMLPDWVESNGARKERRHAMDRGLKVIYA